MKHHFVTRVVAVATLTCLLAAFAMPAAAAPGWTHETWTVSSVLDWLHSLWTGWTGSLDLGEGGGSQASGIDNVYDKAGAVTEPDGVSAMTPSRTFAGPGGPF